MRFCPAQSFAVALFACACLNFAPGPRSSSRPSDLVRLRSGWAAALFVVVLWCYGDAFFGHDTQRRMTYSFPRTTTV